MDVTERERTTLTRERRVAAPLVAVT